MPAALKYYAPGTEGRKQLQVIAHQENQKRDTAYKQALELYTKAHPEQLVVEEGEVNDNVYFNFVRIAADRTAAFLFPTDPVFRVSSTNETVGRIAENTEEKFLREFWNNQGGLPLLHKLATRGFLSGHSFLRIKPPTRLGQYPKVVLYDPRSVTVYWHAEDLTPIWYELVLNDGASKMLLDFVQLDTGFWEIRSYQSKGENSGVLGLWTPEAAKFLRNGVGAEEWVPIGGARFSSTIPPLIDIPHLPHPEDYYGMRAITNAGLQSIINRTASLLNAITRVASEPLDVVTGVTSPSEVRDSGGLLTIPTPGAEVKRLETRGDLAGLKDWLNRQIEVFLSEARVVLLQGDPKSLQRVTNASVRTLFMDMLTQNELLRHSYGTALQQISRIALGMAYANGFNVKYDPDVELRIDFGSALPVDETEIVNVNQLAIADGYMSPQTAAQRLGLVFAQEYYDRQIPEIKEFLEADTKGVAPAPTSQDDTAAASTGLG